MDREIETNIKYFNPSFYKEFVKHMKLLKKLKSNERQIALKEKRRRMESAKTLEIKRLFK